MRNLLYLKTISLLLISFSASSFAEEAPVDIRREVEELKKQNRIILERLDMATEMLEKSDRKSVV